MVRNGFFSHVFRSPYIAEDDEQKFVHFRHFSQSSNNMAQSFMSLVRKNHMILLKISLVIFGVIMVLSQNFINQKNEQVEYQRKMLKLVESVGQVRISSNEYQLYQIGHYKDDNNITDYSYELVDAGKQLADSSTALTQYINHLIDLTIREMKSIYPKIVIIINWVVDQLVMQFCKLTIRKSEPAKVEQKLDLKGIDMQIDWKNINGIKYGVLERQNMFYGAANGTQVEGFMVLMNTTITKEQTTAVQQIVNIIRKIPQYFGFKSKRICN